MIDYSQFLRKNILCVFILLDQLLQWGLILEHSILLL